MRKISQVVFRAGSSFWYLCAATAGLRDLPFPPHCHLPREMNPTAQVSLHAGLPGATCCRLLPPAGLPGLGHCPRTASTRSVLPPGRSLQSEPFKAFSTSTIMRIFMENHTLLNKLKGSKPANFQPGVGEGARNRPYPPTCSVRGLFKQRTGLNRCVRSHERKEGDSQGMKRLGHNNYRPLLTPFMNLKRDLAPGPEIRAWVLEMTIPSIHLKSPFVVCTR